MNQQLQHQHMGPDKTDKDEKVLVFDSRLAEKYLTYFLSETMSGDGVFESTINSRC